MRTVDLSIVIPYLNGSALIGDTLSAIYNTSSTSKLVIEIIIADGGSDDTDLHALDNIISTFQRELDIKLLQISDNSMYEGVINGFEISSGRILSYINCGDGYFEGSFDYAWRSLVECKYDVLVGVRCVKVDNTFHRKIWFPILYLFLQLGLYGRILPFIQQEGSFWTRESWQSVDRSRLRKFKLAGDFFIWKSFSDNGLRFHSPPKRLGYFLRHQNQLSNNVRAYFDEVDDFIPFAHLTRLALRYRFKS